LETKAPALRQLAMLLLIAAVSAFGSAEAVVRLVERRAPAPRAATVAAPAAAVAAQDGEAGSGAVLKASDGHFWAHAQVNGVPVRLLVDTGATVVALTPADAERLGFDLARLHYASSVVTAGGRARAASVRLDSVEVGGARLDDVDALIIEKGLDASLLGMSYLGRLSSFEATRQAMTLTP
jgi:aspartyl protease family protein